MTRKIDISLWQAVREAATIRPRPLCWPW